MLVGYCVISLVLSGCAKRQVVAHKSRPGKNPYKATTARKMSDQIRSVFRISEANQWSTNRAVQTQASADPRIAELIQKLQEEPENLQEQKALAAAYFERELYFESARVYEKIQEKEPDDPSTPLVLARIWDQLGNYSLARHYAKRSLLLDARAFDTFEFLGRIHLHRNDLVAAVDSFRKAAELNPLNASVLANIGYAYLRLNNWERARAYLLQALDLDDGLVEARNNLGIVLAYLGESELALREFSKVNRPAAAFNNLGIVLATEEKWADASNAFEQALSREPHYAKALMNLSEVESHLTPPSIVNLPNQDYSATNTTIVQLEEDPTEAGQKRLSSSTELDSIVIPTANFIETLEVDFQVGDLDSEATAQTNAGLSKQTEIEGLLEESSRRPASAQSRGGSTGSVDEKAVQPLPEPPLGSLMTANRRSYLKELRGISLPVQIGQFSEDKEPALTVRSEDVKLIPEVFEMRISRILGAVLELDKIPRFDLVGAMQPRSNLSRYLHSKNDPVLAEEVRRTDSQMPPGAEMSSEQQIDGMKRLVGAEPERQDATIDSKWASLLPRIWLTSRESQDRIPPQEVHANRVRTDMENKGRHASGDGVRVLPNHEEDLGEVDRGQLGIGTGVGAKTKANEIDTEISGHETGLSTASVSVSPALLTSWRKNKSAYLFLILIWVLNVVGFVFSVISVFTLLRFGPRPRKRWAFPGSSKILERESKMRPQLIFPTQVRRAFGT